MSYWSLRRAAERSTAAAELAHGPDRQQAVGHQRPEIRLPDWTPMAPVPHRVVGTSRSTLRQRVSAFEQRVFTLPEEPAQPDPLSPDGTTPRPRSRW